MVIFEKNILIVFNYFYINFLTNNYINMRMIEKNITINTIF